MAKILLIEDDLELAERLRDWFTLENFMLEAVSTGADALQMLTSFRFDVVVLDWGLPDISGLEVCKRYRATGGRTPIIFLTGKGEIESKEEGLDSGADDYLVKPFDVRELSARIRSILRRPPEMLPTELTMNGISLELESRTMVAGDRRTHLMPKECALLEFLMRHPNRTFSAKSLLDSVWPSESDASEETVRTCMKTLRQKLNKAGREDLIKTVLGSGYVIENANSA